MVAALLAILAAAGPRPVPAADADGAAPVAASAPLEVLEAGRVEHDVATGRGAASGGVLLRRGLVLLRADRATYDTRTGDVEAEGHVLLTEPGRAVAASAVRAVLDGPWRARDVVAYLKDGPLDLGACRTADEARGTGRNRLTLGAAEVRGAAGAGAVEVEGGRLTLCDCGAGAPSWELRAAHATVVPGDHAWLWWPVLWVTPRFLFWHHRLEGRGDDARPIPVLVLPALHVPLKDRQSGLLVPELSLGGFGGTTVTQPLFVTLGESWDATVSATYVGGSTAAQVAAAGRGLQGPGAALELRWAPAEGVAGQVRASGLHSTIPDWPAGAATPPGGDRIAVGLVHHQRLSPDARLDLDAALYGDPFYLADFEADQLRRVAPYRRSAVALTYRGDDLALEADAAYHLPLAGLDANGPGCAGGACGRAPFGAFGADVPVFHRLPAASVTLLPVRLAGPLRLSASAGVARFAPLRGATGDEGADGVGPGELGWVGPADPGERDGRWQPEERLAATRAALRAELRAPLAAGRALTVEPWLAATALGYAPQAGPGPLASARAVAGLTLATALARTFGEGPGRVRHEVAPRVAWVGGLGRTGDALPGGAGGLGGYAYDELDVAAPLPAGAPGGGARRALSAVPDDDRFQQLEIAIRNRVAWPGDAGGRASVDLTLGQDLDLAAGRLGETWVETGLRLGPASVDAAARFRAFGASAAPGTGPATPRAHADSALDAFTALRATARLGDGDGDEVRAGLVAVGEGGSPRLLAGLEPLFDPRPYALDAVASGTVGASARAGAGSLAYDGYFYARRLAASPCGRSVDPHFYQHVATASWDSPCRCWKLGVRAVVNECVDRPQLGVVLDLSALAERGFAR